MRKAILLATLGLGIAAGAYVTLRQTGQATAPAQGVDAAAAMHVGVGEDAVVSMVVHKSPTCGCCGDWVKHVEENGFVTQVENVSDLNPIKDRLGVPLALRSCHTAVADGYVFEGHVPADVIQRFLRERPEGAVGLAVPGMPIGSPGMELPLQSAQPYDIYLFDAEGNARVYASR